MPGKVLATAACRQSAVPPPAEVNQPNEGNEEAKQEQPAAPGGGAQQEEEPGTRLPARFYCLSGAATADAPEAEYIGLIVFKGGREGEYNHSRAYLFDARAANRPVIAAIKAALPALVASNAEHDQIVNEDIPQDHALCVVGGARWMDDGVTMNQERAIAWSQSMVTVLANGEFDSAKVLAVLQADPLSVDVKVLRQLPALLQPNSVIHSPSFVAQRPGTLYHVLRVNYEGNANGFDLLEDSPANRECIDRFAPALEAFTDEIDDGYSFNWLTKTSNPVSEFDAFLRILATEYDDPYITMRHGGFAKRTLMKKCDEFDEDPTRDCPFLWIEETFLDPTKPNMPRQCAPDSEGDDGEE